MKLGIAFLILAVSSTAIAQKGLPKKPYTEWSLREVTDLLQQSPWSQISAKVGPESRDGSNYKPSMSFYVELRLYSALPVRQAIVRRMQLTIPYAKLPDVQRAKYDAEVDGLLKCPQCEEYYIVTIRSASENPFQRSGELYTLDVVKVLKEVPEDELLRHVSLTNDKGERRDAARLVFTLKNEIVFLFRRRDDHGSPLITPGNKKFYIQFDKFLEDKSGGSLKKFTFNVKDIVRDDEVLF